MEIEMKMELYTNDTKNKIEIEIVKNKRKNLINKFIKKFPKIKLHSIIQINKYYNNIEFNDDDNIISNNYIYNYLTIISN
jgi:hypothetical protein